MVTNRHWFISAAQHWAMHAVSDSSHVAGQGLPSPSEDSSKPIAPVTRWASTLCQGVHHGPASVPLTVFELLSTYLRSQTYIRTYVQHSSARCLRPITISHAMTRVCISFCSLYQVTQLVGLLHTDITSFAVRAKLKAPAQRPRCFWFSEVLFF